MTDLETAQYLDHQHPNPWTSGQWYPAYMPDSGPIEIQRTTGKGRSRGQSYLHVRWPITVKICAADTGNIVGEYSSYAHARINLCTGQGTLIS